MIGTIEVGYQFDDVDNETVPGLNESGLSGPDRDHDGADIGGDRE